MPFKVLSPLVQSEVPLVKIQCDDPPPTLDKSNEIELQAQLLSFLSLYFSLVWVKKWKFSIFLLLGKIFYEKVFHDTLERKSAFLGYKNPDKNEFQKVEKLASFQRG